MRNFLSWVAAFAVGLVALVGLITFLNSRDKSGLDSQSAAAGGPGEPYKGQPILSPALQDAVRKGNVVVLYRDAKPPKGTQSLVPQGSKELAKVGQSVVIDREPTLEVPLEAIATKRMQQANTPGELRGFVDYWLGGG